MSKGRILAVDDQRYFRELLERLLTDEDYEVVTASSGEEALRIIEQDHFDVILTDLVMPGMDGGALVARVKEVDPDQDLVVVTGVVDVKTAVDAMKQGASDYLIKPFDRDTLAASLDKILRTRRIEADHGRLLAENIEYLGERSLFERSAALFTCLAVDPLAARIIEGLCLETRAQGGVAWVVDPDRPDALNLAAVRGLVQVADEPKVLDVASLPAGLGADSQASALAPWSGEGGEEQDALFALLRREGRVIGLVRLTDKLGDEEFDSVDQACTEKFLHFGESALTNALRFTALQQSSLADPVTGAFGFDTFHDYVRTEIEKANRFGRSFSLLKLDLGALETLRGRWGSGEIDEWLSAVGAVLKAVVRSADLLASDGKGSFAVLLPETDALGGAVFKQRALTALAASECFERLEEALRPEVHVAGITFPGDGTQLDSLLRVLDERIERYRHSPIRALGLEHGTLAESLATLVEQGERERPAVAESIVRFLLAEVARRPDERGLLVIGPGAGLAEATRAGLDALGEVSVRTDLVIVSADPEPTSSDSALPWLTPPAGAELAPFAVRYSDGARYALVCEDKPDAEGIRIYQTDDPSVVEHLAFQLQRELSLPELA